LIFYQDKKNDQDLLIREVCGLNLRVVSHVIKNLKHGRHGDQESFFALERAVRIAGDVQGPLFAFVEPLRVEIAHAGTGVEATLLSQTPVPAHVHVSKQLEVHVFLKVILPRKKRY
jgi:hypothetical protein